METDAVAGCFSTARWSGRGVRFLAHHLARLGRDAATLGLGTPDEAELQRAYETLGRAAFGARPGIVRLALLGTADGRRALVGRARGLGPDPPAWRAVTAPFPHEDAPAPNGAKCWRRPLYARAAAFAEAAGGDEALLFDRQGRLVEGSRTNLVSAGVDGRPVAPPEARGAVAGIALSIVADRLALTRRDRSRDELPALHELVAVNAVRGARPIVELDGRPVGDGRPGPLARRLQATLDAEP